MWRRWRDELAGLGFATAALDAKLLVGHALGLDTLQIAVREDQLVSRLLTFGVTDLMKRRMAGESVARIIGHREFYGLDFALNEATLEPRPDTELLVDLALNILPPNGLLADLGTGTGCIPIAVLVNRPDAEGIATDISARALDAAGKNAERHAVGDRLGFRQGDWFSALDAGERFDLIVSNPPYIATDVVETLLPEVKDFDPRRALDGGPDGLAPYRVIASGATNWLQPGGVVLVEIGFDQGAAVSRLFEKSGFGEIGVHKDLAGLDRVVSAHHIEVV